jgi:hypothetical protein
MCQPFISRQESIEFSGVFDTAIMQQLHEQGAKLSGVTFFRVS